MNLDNGIFHSKNPSSMLYFNQFSENMTVCIVIVMPLIIKILWETNRIMLLTKIGLILNIIGTLIVAFSFGKNLAEAHQLDKKDRKIYLASFLHPKLFYWGLTIIIIGFIFQVMA